MNQLTTNLKTYFLCEEDETIHWSDILFILGYVFIVGWVFVLGLVIMF